MALINIALGFNYNKGVMNTVVGDIGKLTGVSVGAGKAVSDLSQKMGLLQKVQGLAAVGTLVNNITSAVKGIGGEIKGVFDFVEKYADKGDKIAKMSKLVGLSVKEYQALGSAAQHAGMSVEDVDKSFTRFNINLSKAKGGDAKSLKMFDSILGGRSLSDFSNKTELISAIAEGYTKLDSAEQKAFVSQELFGKSGVKIAELFKDGGESLKSYVMNYKAAFDDDSAESAESFQDSLQDVNESFESMKASIAVDLFPIFKELFSAVKEFLDSKDGGKLKKSISDIVKTIVEFVKDLLPKIPTFLNIILKILDTIGPNVSAFLAAFVVSLPFIVPIITTIAGLVSGPVLAGIGLVVAAVTLWSGVIMDVYENWDMLKSFIVDDVWGAVKQFFSDCVDAVKNWVNMFIADVQWLWNGFKSIFIDPIFNFLDALPQAFNDLWEGFKTGALAAINTVKDLLKSLPVIGGFFNDGSNGGNSNTSSGPVVSAASAAASVIQQSSVTTTNRFAVDFNNAPQGTKITPPSSGDFDWSRSYTLAGAV